MHALQLQLGRSKKVDMIYQSEVGECGLACLAMVSRYVGNDTDLPALRQQYGYTSRGLSLKDMIAMASQLGLSSRPLKLELEELSQLCLPAILHWDMQHFVVLTQVKGDRILINDPAKGERTLSLSDASKHFTGVAIELTRVSHYQSATPARQLSLSSFWQACRGLNSSLAVLFGLSLLLQLTALASPYYMQTVVDEVLMLQSSSLLITLALGFALLLVMETTISSIRQWVILSVSTRLQLYMSASLFQHLLRLPTQFFAQRQLGDLVSRFGSLAAIREQLTTGFVTALLDGLMAIITLVVMWLYSSLLALTVCIFILLYIVIRTVSYRQYRALNHEQLQHQAAEQTHFMESLRGIQTIHQFGLHSQRSAQWQRRLTDSLNTGIRLGKRELVFDSTNQLLFGIENLLVIYIAALAVMDNTMTVGMLFAFISYKSRFTQAADSLIDQLIQLKLLRVHLDRLSDIALATPNKIRSLNMAPASATSAVSSLHIRQLTFQHTALGKPVFANLELHVPPGAVIAIVGKSGTGKSTLAKCIAGLLPATQGQVHYGDNRIHSVEDYGQRLACVLQDDACLSGTLLDNLTGFAEHPCLDSARRAAQLACLETDILAMPMQYHTLIGDMGSSLSGGQLQRLLLARALYRQPEILILDEASSHLDIQTEMAINHNLRRLSVTRIVIAHRPQTIAMADTVYVLEDGQLSRLEHANHSAYAQHINFKEGDAHA